MDNEHQATTPGELSEVAKLMFPESAPPDDGQGPSVVADEPDPDTDTGEQFADDEGSADEPESKQADVPATVKALAETLGVETKDLYERLVVPLGNGKSLTLGEIKHRAQELLKADQLKTEYEDQRSELATERLQFEQEMQTVQEAIASGQPISEDVLQQAQAAQARRLQLRDQAIVRSAPHLQTESAQKAVLEQAEKYAIPRSVLTQFPLPGLILAFDRLAQIEGRIKSATESKQRPARKTQRPTSAPKGKRDLSQLKQDVARGKVSPVDVVAKMLQG